MSKELMPGRAPGPKSEPVDRGRAGGVMVCICRNEQRRRKVIVCSPAGEHPVRFVEIEKAPPKARQDRVVEIGAVFGGGQEKVQVHFGVSGPPAGRGSLEEAVVVIDSTNPGRAEVGIEIGGQPTEARFIDTRGGSFQPCGLSRAGATPTGVVMERAEQSVVTQPEPCEARCDRQLEAA